MDRTEKAKLRSWASTLPPVTTDESVDVRLRLRPWLAEREPATVLIYLPIPGEVDLAPLMEELPGLAWLTTRTPVSGWLSVHPVQSPREVHRYGFEQPREGTVEADPSEADIALVPGVLFDRRGGRLGHGAGYYDELLSRMRPDVVKVGATVERFVVAALPMTADDVRMDWLATESGVRATAG